MDKFEQPSAKLLYLVNEMFKLQLINAQEKLTLKDYVLQEKPEIYQLLEKYPSSEQEINIADALVELLRGQQQQQQQKVEEEEEDYQKNVVLPEEASSPLGNQLMRRKKAKQSNIHEIKGLLLQNNE